MPLVNSDKSPYALRTFLLVLLCSCLALAGWLLVWSDRGFVFSDESFYLLNAKAPASYNVANTQFGYLLQPFYALLGGDVAALRRLFILLVAASGIVAGCIWSRSDDASLESRMPLIAVAGTSALACYFYWVFTPSYNLLIFVGGVLLIGAVGMLYTSRSLLATGILVGL